AAPPLTGRERLQPRLEICLRGPLENIEELENRNFLPVADVVGTSELPVGGVRECADHVRHVDVVTRRRAVAEHERSLTVKEPPTEDRDDAGLTVRVLPGPVDVSEAEDDVRQIPKPRLCRDECLACELRRAVGRKRLRDEGLRSREWWAVALEGPTRGGDDDPRAERGRRLADVERPTHVGGEVQVRSVNGNRDARLRCEVADQRGIELLEPIAELPVVRDVQLCERGLRRYAVTPAGREVVDDEHLVAALEEGVGDVRAEAAGP